MAEQPDIGSAPSTAARPKARRKVLGMAVGALLSVVVGWILLTTPFGTSIVSYSYDQPFQIRGFIEPKEAVLVYLDDASHQHLHQSYTEPWNRSVFTKLLKRMTADKARAVVFDIVFSDPRDPAIDGDFAQAIVDNGRVILAADYVMAEHTPGGGGMMPSFAKPAAIFAESAADLGCDMVDPDQDLCVRRYRPGSPILDQRICSEARSAVMLFDSSLSRDQTLRDSEFWMNYYGPESVIPSVSLYKVITNGDADIPPGFFNDRAVFVGERLSVVGYGERMDEYCAPYSYLRENKFVSGVSIHATAFLNLVRGDYLRRFGWQTERLVIVLVGILFGGGLMLFRPFVAALIGLGGGCLVWAANYLAFMHLHYWFPWAIPVLFQIPLAVVSSFVFFSTLQTLELAVLKRRQI